MTTENLAYCCDCLHYEICDYCESADDVACGHFVDSSRFVKLPITYPLYTITDGRVVSFMLDRDCPLTQEGNVFKSEADAMRVLTMSADKET